MADPRTPPALRRRLELVQQIRAFAAGELRLPVDAHYTRYVDVRRPYVVWNIHAAPEFSLEPKSWWYPVVGRQEYRGYFSEGAARRYAASLRARGYDVFLEGVRAYSTLGWFKEPLLSTFLYDEETELAGLLFHELAHHVVYVGGDTDFNEAFATAVEQEGVRRWLQARGDPAAQQAYAAALDREKQFVTLVMQARDRLGVLYGESPGREASASASRSRGRTATERLHLRAAKAQTLFRLREDYHALRGGWDDSTAYEGWFARPLNNAQLNTVATYHRLVPHFLCLLQNKEGDFELFYADVRALARLQKEQRQRRLQSFAANTGCSTNTQDPPRLSPILP